MDVNKNNPPCTVGQFPHCKTAAGQGTRRRGLESKAVCQVLWGSCLPGRPASFPFVQKDTGSHEEAPFTTSHKHVLSAAKPGETDTVLVCVELTVDRVSASSLSTVLIFFLQTRKALEHLSSPGPMFCVAGAKMSHRWSLTSRSPR